MVLYGTWTGRHSKRKKETEEAATVISMGEGGELDQKRGSAQKGTCWREVVEPALEGSADGLVVGRGDRKMEEARMTFSVVS
jgi:hypothetical protein